MNQKIGINFIAHSFKGNEQYFFDKNYCEPTFIKEIPFDKVGDNLEKDVVAVLFHEKFTFVLNVIPKKERSSIRLGKLLNVMTDEEIFSTDIYSFFGKTISFEGKALEDKFSYSVKEQLEELNKGEANIPRSGFFKFLSLFWSKQGIYRRRVMTITNSFCSSFSAPDFSYSSSIRWEKFKIYKVTRERKKYMLKNSRASRYAPFSMDMKKAIDLSPSVNGFQIPELRDERNRVVTEELYRDVKKESLRYSAINPAKVLRHDPFVVSVYSHSLDCAVMLNFPAKLGKRLQGQYQVNQKLLAVNSYMKAAESGYAEPDSIEIDLIEGEKSNNTWKNVLPVIADFITHDKDQHLIKYYQNKIFKQEEWDRLNEKTNVFFKKFPTGCRLGLLIFHRYPTNAFMKEYYPEKLEENA